MPLPPSPTSRPPPARRLAAQVVGEQQVGRHGHVTAQRRPHREEVARRRDVVHAQDVRAVIEAVRDRRQRAAEPLARAPASVSAPTKSLRETASSTGSPSASQLVQPAQQLDRLRRVLAEIRAGADAAAGRPARRPPARPRGARPGSASRRPRRRRSAGGASFCFGRARVCVTTSAAPDVGAHAGHVGIDQPAGVVDHRPRRPRSPPAPRRACRCRRTRPLPPRRGARPAGTTRSISSAGSTGGPIGDAGLAADVEQVGALARAAPARARRAPRDRGARRRRRTSRASRSGCPSRTERRRGRTGAPVRPECGPLLESSDLAPA